MCRPSCSRRRTAGYWTWNWQTILSKWAWQRHVVLTVYSWLWLCCCISGSCSTGEGLWRRCRAYGSRSMGQETPRHRGIWHWTHSDRYTPQQNQDRGEHHKYSHSTLVDRNQVVSTASKCQKKKQEQDTKIENWQFIEKCIWTQTGCSSADQTFKTIA